MLAPGPCQCRSSTYDDCGIDEADIFGARWIRIWHLAIVAIILDQE